MGRHYRQTGAQADTTGRQGPLAVTIGRQGHRQKLQADRGTGSHYKPTGAQADTTSRQGHWKPPQADKGTGTDL